MIEFENGVNPNPEEQLEENAEGEEQEGLEGETEQPEEPTPSLGAPLLGGAMLGATSGNSGSGGVVTYRNATAARLINPLPGYNYMYANCGTIEVRLALR